MWDVTQWEVDLYVWIWSERPKQRINKGNYNECSGNDQPVFHSLKQEVQLSWRYISIFYCYRHYHCQYLNNNKNYFYRFQRPVASVRIT